MDNNRVTVETYDQIASQYTDLYFDDTKTDLPMMDKFLELLPQSATILDVGNGPGQFTKYMMKKRFDVVGIDMSDSMLSIARHKVPEGKFRKMDMRAMDFPERSFDGLLSAYSLIHIPSNQLLETLRGFYRVLKPNGVMLVITQKGEKDYWADEPLAPGKKTFFNFFTAEKITKYLKNAGFRVESQKIVPITDPYAKSDAIIYTIAKKI